MSSMGFVDSKAASQIQNLLICIEMFIASIAHFYIFPYQEWQEGYKKGQKNVLINETLAVGDFIADFRNVVSRWENTSNSSNHESSHLISMNIEDSNKHHHGIKMEEEESKSYTLSSSLSPLSSSQRLVSRSVEIEQQPVSSYEIDPVWRDIEIPTIIPSSNTFITEEERNQEEERNYYQLQSTATTTTTTVTEPMESSTSNDNITNNKPSSTNTLVYNDTESL